MYASCIWIIKYSKAFLVSYTSSAPETNSQKRPLITYTARERCSMSTFQYKVVFSCEFRVLHDGKWITAGRTCSGLRGPQCAWRISGRRLQQQQLLLPAHCPITTSNYRLLNMWHVRGWPQARRFIPPDGIVRGDSAFPHQDDQPIVD